jgi:hypothetical protein
MIRYLICFPIHTSRGDTRQEMPRHGLALPYEHGVEAGGRQQQLLRCKTRCLDVAIQGNPAQKCAVGDLQDPNVIPIA